MKSHMYSGTYSWTGLTNIYKSFCNFFKPQTYFVKIDFVSNLKPFSCLNIGASITKTSNSDSSSEMFICRCNMPIKVYLN